MTGFTYLGPLIFSLRKMLRAGSSTYFHAILVGTADTQAEDVAEKIKELKSDKG